MNRASAKFAPSATPGISIRGTYSHTQPGVSGQRIDGMNEEEYAQAESAAALADIADPDHHTEDMG